MRLSPWYFFSIGRVDSDRSDADDVTGVPQARRLEVENYAAEAANTSDYGAHIQLKILYRAPL